MMNMQLNNEDFKELSQKYAQAANQLGNMTLNMPAINRTLSYRTSERRMPRNRGFAALPQKLRFNLTYSAIRALGMIGSALAGEVGGFISRRENRERNRQEWNKFNDIRNTAASLGEDKVSEMIDEVAEGSWEKGD